MLTTQLRHISLHFGRILKHAPAPSRRKTSRHLIDLHLQNSSRIGRRKSRELQTLRRALQQRRQQWTGTHARRKIKLLLSRRFHASESGRESQARAQRIGMASRKRIQSIMPPAKPDSWIIRFDYQVSPLMGYNEQNLGIKLFRSATRTFKCRRLSCH